MSKLPFMQFFPGDWMKDTRCLSLEARGAWIDLICLLWDSPTRGKLTWPITAFDQFLGTIERDQLIYSAAEILNELSKLNICDVVTDGNGDVTLSCRRMIREEAERIRTRDRVKRFRNGDCNGDVTEMKRRIYQKSEVRSHISEKNKRPPPVAFALPDWLRKEAWEGFEESRKKSRHPMTNHAKDLIVSKLRKFKDEGLDPNAILDQSTVNAWQDVFPPRSNNNHSESNQPQSHYPYRTGALAKLKALRRPGEE